MTPPATAPPDLLTLLAALFLLLGVPAILFGLIMLYTGYVRHDAERYLAELEAADDSRHSSPAGEESGAVSTDGEPDGASAGGESEGSSSADDSADDGDSGDDGDSAAVDTGGPNDAVGRPEAPSSESESTEEGGVSGSTEEDDEPAP